MSRKREPWSRVERVGPATLYQGDCRDVMRALAGAGETVHACVTDPPYELGFMGKAWDKADGVASDRKTWGRVLDLLAPGGHCLAFAGSRTYHRIATAIEKAGFEIRDQLMWLYGSGFPKSLDVSKSIDKAGGVWRGRAARALPDDGKRAFGQNYERTEKGEPVSDAARAWNGWGTALKPAHEPIAMARKSFSGTVAANVLTHGTGAINVGACSVGNEFLSGQAMGQPRIGTFEHNGIVTPDRWGRWPANVLTDGSPEVLEALPRSGRHAIKFFYSPKASKEDREFGLDGVALAQVAPRTAHDRDRDRMNRNIHPTVKPVDLMAWLCRLVTPPDGIVLDPFMGSGSTGIAAVRHGYRFVGCEQSPDYFEIACRRVAAAVAEEERMPRIEREITRAARGVQISMFEGALQ